MSRNRNRPGRVLSMHQTRTVRAVRVVGLPPEFNRLDPDHRQALLDYFDGQDFDREDIQDESHVALTEVQQVDPGLVLTMEDLGLYEPDDPLVFQLQQLLAQRMRDQASQYRPDQTLEEQGLDSLDVAEFLMDIQDEFVCPAPDLDTRGLTLNRLSAYVRSHRPNL